MSVGIVNNILKACLIPLNKSEFKFIEYKIDIKKLFGLCDIFNIDIYKFDNVLQYKNKITQQQINEIFDNSCNNIFDSIDTKITNSIEYDKELLKELLKLFDLSISESINQQTNSIDFLKLFEEITHKKIIQSTKNDEVINDNQRDELTNSKQEESTTEEVTSEVSSDELTNSKQESTTEEVTNQNNSIKYLILLFREFGIISKDKRTNKINPEYKKYFIKSNNHQNDDIQSNQIIKPILNEPQIDFDYFEPKKTNGRIIRPLKLLKIIKEQRNKDINKKQLLDDLITSEYIEISKQDRQTYYYIKKGVIDDFHKWLIKKYF